MTVIHWIAIYPVDSVVYPWNNWAQKYNNIIFFNRKPTSLKGGFEKCAYTPRDMLWHSGTCRGYLFLLTFLVCVVVIFACFKSVQHVLAKRHFGTLEVHHNPETYSNAVLIGLYIFFLISKLIFQQHDNKKQQQTFLISMCLTSSITDSCVSFNDGDFVVRGDMEKPGLKVLVEAELTRKLNVDVSEDNEAVEVNGVNVHGPEDIGGLAVEG